MMDALKNCPFCEGGAALQAQQGNNPAPFAWHAIHHCEGGFMRFGENCGFTKDEAIAAWNRRAPLSAHLDAERQPEPREAHEKLGEDE